MRKNFSKLNEEIDTNFNPNSRLRHSIHEILVDIKSDKITFLELSTLLIDEYKIDISADILKEILNDWDLKKNYTIFKKSDNSWLDVWGYQGYIKSKLRLKQNFGKHRYTSQWKSTAYTPPVTNWRGSYPKQTTIGGVPTSSNDDMNRFGYYNDQYYD